jgi:uncharacterized membrane protein YbaN (DUF454 family)
LASGLAVIGVLVPGLPATVFALTAFYCFSKGTPQLATWLLAHAWLGPLVRDHVAYGGLSWPAKRAALAGMWTSILASAVFLYRAYPVAAFLTVGLGGLGTVVVVWGVRTVAAPHKTDTRWESGLA